MRHPPASRPLPPLVGAALLFGLTFCARAARADDAPPHTQANLGLRAGVAGQSTEQRTGSLWAETLFAAGLSGDILFGRTSPRSFGFGPTAAVSTLGFRDVNASLGASLLLPVHHYLPFVLSAGPLVRYHSDFGTQAGAFASLFWGSRSFNYTGTWGLVGGLVLEGRALLGTPNDHAILLGAHLDLQVLALPAVMIINAVR